MSARFSHFIFNLLLVIFLSGCGGGSSDTENSAGNEDAAGTGNSSDSGFKLEPLSEHENNSKYQLSRKDDKSFQVQNASGRQPSGNTYRHNSKFVNSNESIEISLLPGRNDIPITVNENTSFLSLMQKANYYTYDNSVSIPLTSNVFFTLDGHSMMWDNLTKTGKIYSPSLDLVKTLEPPCPATTACDGQLQKLRLFEGGVYVASYSTSSLNPNDIRNEAYDVNNNLLWQSQYSLIQSALETKGILAYTLVDWRNSLIYASEDKEVYLFSYAKTTNPLNTNSSFNVKPFLVTVDHSGPTPIIISQDPDLTEDSEIYQSYAYSYLKPSPRILIDKYSDLLVTSVGQELLGFNFDGSDRFRLPLENFFSAFDPGESNTVDVALHTQLVDGTFVLTLTHKINGYVNQSNTIGLDSDGKFVFYLDFPVSIIDANGYLYTYAYCDSSTLWGGVKRYGLHRLDKKLTADNASSYVIEDCQSTKLSFSPAAIAPDGGLLKYSNYTETYSEREDYLVRDRFEQGINAPGAFIDFEYLQESYPTQVRLSASTDHLEGVGLVSWLDSYNYEVLEVGESYDVSLADFQRSGTPIMQVAYLNGNIAMRGVEGNHINWADAPTDTGGGSGSGSGGSCSVEYSSPNYGEYQIESLCQTAWVYCNSGSSEAVAATCGLLEGYGQQIKNQCSYCSGY